MRDRVCVCKSVCVRERRIYRRTNTPRYSFISLLCVEGVVYVGLCVGSCVGSCICTRARARVCVCVCMCVRVVYFTDAYTQASRTCTHTHTHMHTHTHVGNTRRYTCILFLCVRRIGVYLYSCADLLVYACAYLCACMCVCVHVRMCVFAEFTAASIPVVVAPDDVSCV